jgi:glutamate 5-kinase
VSRQKLREWTKTGRIVVKVGSGVLTDGHGRIEPKTIRRLANEIAPLIGLRRWPFVVSSGAIAVGMSIMELKTRPKTMAGLQAAAAIGQSKLVEAWSQAFRKFEVPVAQVLLTHADLANRKRYLNARRALAELEKRRAVAIINENDTVSFEEIAFGDNDELAAQVANVVDANLLVMLSVAPGVNRDGARIPEIVSSDPLLDLVAERGTSRFGSGGMVSKIRAARVACSRGAAVAIIPGKEPGMIARLMAGEDVGTLILPDRERETLSSRDYWIAHTLRPSGKLLIDDGAVRALTDQKKSLLPSGVTAVEGQFSEGDAVEIAHRHKAIARGLVRYSAEQMKLILGKPSNAIPSILGFSLGAEVVHRDDLVLLDKSA